MKSSRLNNCLTIIALSIFADDRVNPLEVETFSVAARKLPVVKEESLTLTNVDLMAWYNNNKIRILMARVSETYTRWLPNQLSKITDRRDQHAILEIMHDISISDHEYHVREKALMMFIARQWGIEFSYA